MLIEFIICQVAALFIIIVILSHHLSRCATQVATRAGASTASSTPPRRFSTEGDKLFSPFSFDIFCEVVLFVLIFCRHDWFSQICLIILFFP